MFAQRYVDGSDRGGRIFFRRRTGVDRLSVVSVGATLPAAGHEFRFLG
jgi:hypothetical protein